MSAARAGVVIVSHDTRGEALGIIASLRTHDGPIVLVDSGSKDGTADAVRDAFPSVHVLTLDNLGFGGAANVGVAALDAAVDVVVIANADVRFLPGAVIALTAALDDAPDVAVVGPRVRYPDGSHQASARRSPGVRDALVHGLIGWLVPSNPVTRRYRALDLTGPEAVDDVDVDWVSGCAFAVRRRAFDAVGGFDTGYRLFVEDVDLCDRVRSAGWRVRFVPDAVVIHRVGASTTAHPLRARLAHARGLERYVSARMHGAQRLLRPFLWLGLAGWTVATTAASVLRRGHRSTTGESRSARSA